MLGPLIEKNTWGYNCVKYNNNIFEYGNKNEKADILIWFDGCIKWDWKNRKTFCNRHNPGISKKAVQFLKKKGCEIIILSKGYGDPSFKTPGILQTQNSVITYLKTKDIEVYHLKSEYSVKKYNELIQDNKKVGMLLHSTC